MLEDIEKPNQKKKSLKKVYCLLLISTLSFLFRPRILQCCIPISNQFSASVLQKPLGERDEGILLKTVKKDDQK